MADSKTIAGMDLALINHVKTLQQYGDQLTILPDKHRVMMKFLGPLYDAHMKLNMGLESVKTTFGGAGKEGEKATKGMAKGGKLANKSLGSMVKTVGALGVVFVPLTAALTLTKGLFTGIIATMMPLMGMAFAVMAAMMLLVAVFDTGGGSLRAWLTDLPLVGDAFGLVQGGVDKVKGALGAIDWEGIKGSVSGVASVAGEAFGPVWTNLTGNISNTISQQKDRILALWETLKANITLPEMDAAGFFQTIADAMTVTFDIFFGLYNLAYTLIFDFITQIVEMGFVQIWIDGIMGIWTAIEGAYNDIVGAFEGTGVTVDEFFGAIMDLYNYFMDFLVSSGIFDYYKEFQAMALEFIAFAIFIIGKVVAIVIKFVMWAWPYVKPYYKMLINAIGFIITPIMLVWRILFGVVRIIMALLMGNTDKAKKIFSGLVDAVKGAFTSMKNFAKGFVRSLVDLVWPIFSLLNKGMDAASKIPGFGWLEGVQIKKPSFRKGGVSSGSPQGYDVELHGTEAVVPLPDGRSIPVTIKGMGNGGNTNNITINVSGVSGDGRKIARQISEEVARALRSRTRGSGGISRGI
tara:strand:- start:38601 stop:40331 length:1731 start_codon:yes stop_codon:yes gene_type:complete